MLHRSQVLSNLVTHTHTLTHTHTHIYAYRQHYSVTVLCSFNWTLDNGHSQVVRGMDYNPNQMYHFATCGDDCCAKFWDARKLDKPLITRQDHSHWSVLFYVCVLLSQIFDKQVVILLKA